MERIRINIEIFCESMGDFLGSSLGGLKKPLQMLAGLALVMTLRSARTGVQKMKNGGLTAGGHDATFKAYQGGTVGRGPTRTTGYGSGPTSLMKPNTPGLKGTQPTPTYGAQPTPTNTYGATTSGGYGATSTYGSTGTSGYNNPSTSSYGASSAYGGSTSGGAYGSTSASGGAYGSTSGSMASGGMASGQAQRAVADLIDRHGGAVRVMNSHLFKDYGGVHEFYGQVETLQAFDGAGVVEKVLQVPGHNKVLVVDGGGNVNIAIFGKTAAASAKQNGWNGVIIHGSIRDAKQVGQTAIGCKALGTNPNRGGATSGSKGSPLVIFDMPISTGMWVYADKVSGNIIRRGAFKRTRS